MVRDHRRTGPGNDDQRYDDSTGPHHPAPLTGPAGLAQSLRRIHGRRWRRSHDDVVQGVVRLADLLVRFPVALLSRVEPSAPDAR